MRIIEAIAAYKVCIFGEVGVGKTSLTQRFMTGSFEQDTKTTMGASIFVKYIIINNKKIGLQLWDFGGEEKYRFLLPVYAYGSSAGIFMYDITRYATLKKAEPWLSCFKEGLDKENSDSPILLVGAKLDLESNRTVKQDDIEDLLKKNEFFDHIECSAKSGENVEELFQLIVKELFKHSSI